MNKTLGIRRSPRSAAAFWVILGLCIALPGPASGQGSDLSVGVGRPAPPLEVGRWLKGGPVDRFEPGRVYVVETWATWCSPCLRAMPHLSELQEKFRGRAVFIGVDIWEQDASAADRFIAQRGEQIAYAVAQDSVPPGLTFFEGKFAKSWIEAAGKYSVGVPLAFIVDGAGRVAWIGHPMDLDEPLDRVVSGRWDMAAAKARYDAEMKEAAKSEPFKVAYYASQRRNDWRGAAEACDALLRLEPEEFAEWAGREYLSLAVDGKRPDLALGFAREAVEERFASKPHVLAELARAMARTSSRGQDPSALEVAGMAAERAVKIAGEDKPFALAAVACVLFAKGEKDRAIGLQRRALENAKGKDEKTEMESLLDFMLKNK